MQEVLRFLEQLITGMGQNVEFHVAHIYEDDDDLTAGVDWHLGTFSIYIICSFLLDELTRVLINGVPQSGRTGRCPLREAVVSTD